MEVNILELIQFAHSFAGVAVIVGMAIIWLVEEGGEGE